MNTFKLIKKLLLVIYSIANTCATSFGAEQNIQLHQKHLMFVIGGGTHIRPTFEIVKGRIEKGSRVTYVVWNQKSAPDFIQLEKLGAKVLFLQNEMLKINKNLSPEQKFILENPVGNFVDQKLAGSIQDPSVLNQYFMAILWDELLMLTKQINPDSIVYDTYLGYWGRYVAQYLQIPSYLSMPIAFNEEWTHPNFKKNNKKDYYQKLLPATSKRNWAAHRLKTKLGRIANDIDVDFPLAFPSQKEAMFVYTYPQLEGYSGYNSLGTNIIFAGYKKLSNDINLEQNKIIESVTKIKGNKKLFFVSMGTAVGKPLEFFRILGETFGNNNDIVVALHPGRSVSLEEEHDAKTIQDMIEDQGYTNFIVYNSFPLPDLFKIVDVFIGHGGANSSMQALQNNVPIILLPFAGDQLIMAKKLSALNLAITILDELNPCDYNIGLKSILTSDIKRQSELIQWLRQAVKTSLSQSSEIRQKTISSLLSGEDGYEVIVDVIGKFKY